MLFQGDSITDAWRERGLSDGLFAAAVARRIPTHWAEDGVHPTPAGRALIARSWLEAFGVALAIAQNAASQER